MDRATIWLLAVISIGLASGCTEEAAPAVEIAVMDEAGLPVAGAKVTLHLDRLDWADHRSGSRDSALRLDSTAS